MVPESVEWYLKGGDYLKKFFIQIDMLPSEGTQLCFEFSSKEIYYKPNRYLFISLLG